MSTPALCHRERKWPSANECSIQGDSSMQLQLLEVAIGLVAAFFLVSVMASATVELGSVLFKKRSKDLRIVLDEMLSTGSVGAIDLRATSIWHMLQAASRRKRGVRKSADKRTPSYMSARAFADAVVEGITRLKTAGKTADDVIDSLPGHSRTA